ncbi:tetratricopeptide repeat protein 23-like [Corticium candelabrum]|uniref:tetratricopeptide repeat protein 23-like n=1 Tax=Corticium candelabrum TaxID=121492 RepID=UPI002E256831|nr:tetratricopeptide repeat protein 23-like [Corticium candelabrum]
MASGHLEVVIPSSLGAGQLHSSLVEARNVDVAHNSDSDDASDDLQDEQVAAEVLLEKNWKRYRLRAKKRQGHFAVRSLVRCLALTRIVHGDDSWRRAHIHSELATAYLELQDMPMQAVKHSQTAVDMTIRLYQKLKGDMIETGSENYGDDDQLGKRSNQNLIEILTVLSSAHFGLGKALFALGKYAEGEAALVNAQQYADELQCSSTYSNQVTTVEIYKALGLCCLKQKKTRLAGDYLDQAEKLAINLYGEDAVQMIDIHQNMGKVRQQRNELEGAVEEYLKAFSIAVTRNGQESASAAGAGHCLAAAYLAIGGSDAETVAEGYLNDCLAIYQRLHGPQSKKSVEIQKELCRLMLRMSRHKEATELLLEVVRASCLVYGDPSAEVAASYKLLGTVFLSQGHVDRTLVQYQKSYEMFRTVCGPRHKQTVDVQQKIDMLARSSTAGAETTKKSFNQRPRFRTVVK